MMIPQSVTDWTCFMNTSLDPDAFYQRCRDIGYTGAEMVPASRRDAARAAGLELLNLPGPGMEQGLNRIEHHATLLPQITQAMEEAARASIPWVIVFSGLRQNQSNREGIANCARGLRALIPDCDRLDVGLLFEMFNTRDHPDYQADTGAYGFELIEQVGSSRLKLLYDAYHMEMSGDDVLADVPGHVDAIGHLHLAAAPGRTCTADTTTLDPCRLVSAAMNAGYRGFAGQEFLFDDTEDPLDALRRAYQATAPPTASS